MDAGDRAAIVEEGAWRGNEQEWSQPHAQAFGAEPSAADLQELKRDPEEMKKYLDKTFPGLRAKARRVGAAIYFVDEASVRSDAHRGTTWGKIGQTPAVDDRGDRFSIRLISAVSPRGDMKFSSFTGRMNAIRFVNFLKKLHADVGRPIIVIADNASYHTGGVVQRYVKQTRGQVTIGSLPRYSPELIRTNKCGITRRQDSPSYSWRLRMSSKRRCPRFCSRFKGRPILSSPSFSFLTPSMLPKLSFSAYTYATIGDDIIPAIKWLSENFKDNWPVLASIDHIAHVILFDWLYMGAIWTLTAVAFISVILALLATPIIALLIRLAYGRWLLLTALFIELSVETTPPGEWRVNQLDLNDELVGRDIKKHGHLRIR